MAISKPSGGTVAMLIILGLIAFIYGFAQSDSYDKALKVAAGIGAVIGFFIIPSVVGLLVGWRSGKWQTPFMITFFVILGLALLSLKQ